MAGRAQAEDERLERERQAAEQRERERIERAAKEAIEAATAEAKGGHQQGRAMPRRPCRRRWWSGPCSA